MKASVDPELCTGCGLCTDLCGDVFELEGETATTKVDEVPEEHEEACRDAAEQCPVEAIQIED
ncbi:MAG: ferredoxin [Pirellulales bacterium]|nr:ferredoxin [Pirellulales bacterium]